MRFPIRIPRAGRIVAAAVIVVIGLAPGSVRAEDGFRMTGEIDGLFPGIETALQATVTNEQSFAIVVTAVVVTALDSSADCPGSLLRFGQLDATVNVSPGAAAVVRIPVRLDVSTPESCQDAAWPLEFSGTAVSADSGSGGGSLPPTGAGLGGTIAIAAGLAGAGLLALGPRRLRDARRRRTELERRVH